MSGRLYVVATPIGNLADITLRAVRVLGEVDVVAAEDTRTTRKLLTHHDVHTPLVSYHRHNEDERTSQLLERLRAGESVALVSEAGTPSISDPGHRLVEAAIADGIPVEALPGPSALLTALVVSGLPTEGFVFDGFLPRRSSDRRRRLEAVAEEPRTLVLFEAPHRLDACLADVLDVLGDRQIAMCRELTKLHEEIRRGRVSEIIDGLKRYPVKGEIVLVVEGAEPAEPDLGAATDEAVERVDAGESVRDAVRAVSTARGVSRRALYDRVLRATKDESER